MIITTDKFSSLINELNKKRGNKILVYCSSVKKANNLSVRLQMNFPSSFIDSLSSDTSKKYQDISIKKFKHHEGLSILCLCKLFIVGFDEPCIDTIVHYDKCNSVIELTQKNGRATRLYPRSKIRSTFVFMIDESKSSDFSYYRKIMKKLIMEDTRLQINLQKLSETKKLNEHNAVQLTLDIPEFKEEVITYDRYINLLLHGDKKVSYNETINIIKNYNIKTKEEYFEMTKKDIRLPEKPKEYFKEKFNWIEFLNIKKDKYFSLEECKKQCSLHIEKDSEMIKFYQLYPYEVCKKLYHINPLFPPHDIWLELYMVDNIHEIIFTRKRIKKHYQILSNIYFI